MHIPDSYSSPREKTQSAIITALFFTCLLLFLWFYKLITPDPPFPEGGGGGGMMMALGLADMGSENIDFQHMGQAEQIMTEEEFKEMKEEILTDEESDVAITKDDKKENKEEKKEEVKNKPVIIKEEKPQKSEAELLAEKFKKNQGKNNSGTGDIIGQQGDPNGIPGGTGSGGQGGGKGGGIGPGEGAGSGPGKGTGIGGGVRFDLRGRSIVKPPLLPRDTQEEGVVVVEIVVDADGNVIEANPNGRGTTTNSALLKAKARQAALATKFNKADNGIEEQRGTITIVFSFD
ncbi:MAG: hypothetical protein N3F09_01400 [Bacteroidia bacterium]|nr:hypothetical protein [Bacteroidia bacterium]